MKLLLASGLLVLLAYVCAEHCFHDDECVITVCALRQKVDCWHNENDKRDSKLGECTCVPTDHDGGSGVTCTNGTDCVQNYAACSHHDHRWHCIDGRCRCNY